MLNECGNMMQKSRQIITWHHN